MQKNSKKLNLTKPNPGLAASDDIQPGNGLALLKQKTTAPGACMGCRPQAREKILTLFQMA